MTPEERKQEKAKKLIKHSQNPEMATFLEHSEIADSLKNIAEAFGGMKIETIKGDKGDDGYTPVAGEDFYTEKDIDDVVDRAAKLATPIKGKDYFTDSDIKEFKNYVKPIKDVDYFTKKEIDSFKRDVTPIKGIDYTDGIDGIDGESIKGDKGDKGDNGSPDEPLEIVDKLESLEGEERLDAKAIKNLPTMIATMIGITGIKEIRAGSNITIDNSVLGYPIISSTGGGGGSVSSVFGRTGVVIAQSGDYTTGLVTEGSNLYFTDERAQDAVGSILTDSSTIDFTYNDGANTITGIVIDGSITNAKVSSGIDAVKIANGSVSNTEFQYLDGVTSSIQTQFTGKQNTLTLTTTGTTGAATLVGATLNIPQYAGTTYTGTTNRITVTGSVIDIAATYVGQTSITTVGTIGSGTWQGSTINYAYLGSGGAGTGLRYLADDNTWKTYAGGGGTVSSVASADGSITVTNPTSTVDLAVVKAPIWSTARLLAGNSVNGSANVPFANKFIVQGTTDTGLTGAQFLGTLGTGIVKNTTTTGVLSIAVAADFPTLNQNTTGSAATLTIPRTIGIITGDAASTGSSFDGSANNTNALTLATVNANVGTFGSATQASVFTVNAKGLITAASNTTITPAVGSITGLATGIATFLATPTSANLAAAVTNETGSGLLVFGTAPSISGATITTSTVNGVTLTTGGSATTFLNGAGSYTTPASSLVIGNAVSGGGANRVLYEDASQNLAASANMTFSGNSLSLTTSSASVTPLVVNGAVSQTNPFYEIKDSGGFTYFSVTPTSNGGQMNVHGSNGAIGGFYRVSPGGVTSGLDLAGYNSLNLINSGSTTADIVMRTYGSTGNAIGTKWIVYNSNFEFLGYQGIGGEVKMSDLFTGDEIFHSYLDNTSSNFGIRFYKGKQSFGFNSAATSQVEIVGNTTTKASLKLQLGGSLLTTPQAGAIEAINSHIYWTDSTNTRYQLDQQSGGGTPGGSTTQLQYNNAGAFGGISRITTNGNDIILTGQASPTYTQGKLVYDTDNESLTFYNNNSNVSLQIGQEEWIRVTNNTGSTIANGAAVYINGASAGLPTIALAQSNAAATTIGAGLTTNSIANGAIGYVTCIGLVRSIDTSAFTAGQTVYISSTVAGGLTATAPTAPNYRYRIGIVGVSSSTVGTIHVTPSTAALGNGTANQLFGMNTAGTAQELKSIVAGTGITVTPGTNSLTIAANTTSSKVIANRATSAQSIPNNSTTTILFNAESIDLLAEYNPTTGIFTAANTGYYQVNTQIYLSTAALGSALTIFIFVNGVEYNRATKTFPSGDCSIEINEMVLLNTTDTLDVRLYQNSGSAASVYSSATFPGTHLSIAGLANVTASSDANINLSNLGTTAINQQLNLVAGTTGVAPLKLTAGTNLTTATAGAVEYDGKAFYNTATASSRSIVPATQFTVQTTDYTLTNGTALQAAFAGTQDAFTVNANTSYFFEGFFFINTGTIATTVSFGVAVSGTTISNIIWEAQASSGASNTTGTASTQTTGVSTTPIIVVPSAANAWKRIRVTGWMTITVAGTFIPSIQFSAAPGGTNLMKVGSWFKLWAAGSDTVTQVGNVA